MQSGCGRGGGALDVGWLTKERGHELNAVSTTQRSHRTTRCFFIRIAAPPQQQKKV